MYYECKQCHAHVDAGELTGGICEECRDQNENNRTRAQEIERMIMSVNFKQMEVEEFIR